MEAPVTLPSDFEQAALAQFDRLLEQGRLFYEPARTEVVECAELGFTVEFMMSAAINKKPILGRDAPERRGQGGPFINPDPAFVVARMGEGHVLEMSMHCMYRPHFVLHTRLFAPQTDDLDLGDISAAMAVMKACETTGPNIMIYNCGYDAGASQGHKHVQVFRAPGGLFPERAAKATEDTISSVEGVPFRHFVLRLRPGAGPDLVLGTYQRLLVQAKQAHDEFANGGDGGNGGDSEHGDGPAAAAARAARAAPPAAVAEPRIAYNVAMTADWMCLVPRRRGGRGDASSSIGANTLGMLGVVWVASQRERDEWMGTSGGGGIAQNLVFMGYPLGKPAGRQT